MISRWELLFFNKSAQKVEQSLNENSDKGWLGGKFKVSLLGGEGGREEQKNVPNCGVWGFCAEKKRIFNMIVWEKFLKKKYTEMEKKSSCSVWGVRDKNSH